MPFRAHFPEGEGHGKIVAVGFEVDAESQGLSDHHAGVGGLDALAGARFIEDQAERLFAGAFFRGVDGERFQIFFIRTFEAVVAQSIRIEIGRHAFLKMLERGVDRRVRRFVSLFQGKELEIVRNGRFTVREDHKRGIFGRRGNDGRPDILIVDPVDELVPSADFSADQGQCAGLPELEPVHIADAPAGPFVVGNVIDHPCFSVRAEHEFGAAEIESGESGFGLEFRSGFLQCDFHGGPEFVGRFPLHCDAGSRQGDDAVFIFHLALGLPVLDEGSLHVEVVAENGGSAFLRTDGKEGQREDEQEHEFLLHCFSLLFMVKVILL
ncbi:MAG: hypothetical protein BWY31_03950 [Lentisphaerae bacterium ADurb.Bin242]|nr:MAG: hypothetical protein BWY31_03950 [Lentisphaerae bacterium ADurb.Bin242]